MNVSSTKAIHELKNELSGVLARLAETGEEVTITKHGKVIARLVPPEPSGVVFGAGGHAEVAALELDDLVWSNAEIDSMLGLAIEPE